MQKVRKIDRREFLKIAGVGVAGMTVLGGAGCGGGGDVQGGGEQWAPYAGLEQ